MSILVCGGADYIDAHVVRLLRQCGDRVVIADDLSTFNAAGIGDTPLVRLDVATDEARSVLSNLMMDEDVTTVIHFSARKQVGESVARPIWYYQQNVGGMVSMLAVVGDADVGQMIFSSSAAIYGIPTTEVITEDMAEHPINPYNETKLIGEWMMADCERVWDLKWIGLRYFNVTNAGWSDLADPAIMNLIPMVLDYTERGESAKIFDIDYDAPDSTCVHDYIHVLGLAEAHIAALGVFTEGRQPDRHTCSVGTGLGTSVREIIDGLRRIIDQDSPVEELGRCTDDPPELIGDPLSIGVDLGWKANNGLDEVLTSTWEGQQAGPRPITIPDS